MKKILMISLFLILIATVFGQTVSRPLFVQLFFAEDVEDDILDVITNGGATHNENYHFTVLHIPSGIERIAGVHSTNTLRIYQEANIPWARVDQTGWPSVWPIGSSVRLKITNLNGRSVEREYTIPEGSNQIFFLEENGIVIPHPDEPGPSFLFNSNDGDLITGADELDIQINNNVYRATGWNVIGTGNISNSFWQFQFSSLGYEEMTLSSMIRRQYEFDEDLLEDFNGPRAFRTYYSINDGESWINYPVGVNYLLGNNSNWLNIGFDLPAEINNQNSVMIRLSLHASSGMTTNSPWGEIKDVLVTSETMPVDPNPTVAVNPSPANESEGVVIDLPVLSWSYIPHPAHTNPAGFRVYLNPESDEFDPNIFQWISYIEEQEDYTLALAEYLEYETTYFWKVIPTTIIPERTRNSRTNNISLRDDAVNCPVWSFTTVDTPFVINEFPWNESFEGVQFPPEGWGQIFVIGATEWVRAIGGNANNPEGAADGQYNALFYRPGLTDHINKLVSPQLDLSQINSPILKFWHAQTAWTGDQDELRIFYRVSDVSEWVMIAEYTDNITAWTERRMLLPEPSDSYYIAFEATGSYAYGVVLDDITVSEAPGSPVFTINPESADFLNVQIGTTSEAQLFTITNDGGGTMIIAPEDITMTGDIDDFILHNIPETINLEPGQSAAFSVQFAPITEGEKTAEITIEDNIIEPRRNTRRSLRDRGSREEHTVVVTGVGIDATVNEFPWSEDFENEQFPPAGWVRHNMDGGGQVWVSSTEHNHTPAGSRSAHHNFGASGYLEDGWLVSPPIVLEANECLLRFWSYNTWTADYARNSVLISSGSSNPADNEFVEIWSPDTVSNQWVQTILSLNDFANETIFVAFRYQGTFSHGWYLDDISVIESPINPVLDINPISHNFGTQQVNSTGESFSIFLTNVGGGVITISPDDISLIGVDSEHFVLSTIVEPIILNAAQSASINLAFAPSSLGVKNAVLVIEDNITLRNTRLARNESNSREEHTIPLTGEGVDNTVSEFPWLEDFEEQLFPPTGWSRYNIDGGGLQWIANIAQNHTPGGSRSAFHSFGGSGYQEEGWLVSPPLSLPAEAQFLSFWSYNTYPNDYGSNAVLISTGSSNPLENDFVEVWSPLQVSADWQQSFVSLAPYVGETIYIAFKYEGTYAHAWYLDDVEIYDAPNTPLFAVSPASLDYGFIQVETTSLQRNFTITNLGGGVLTLNPEDIRITGTDLDEFALSNIEQTVNLESMQSVSVAVSFSPVSEGAKNAYLEIDDNIEEPVNNSTRLQARNRTMTREVHQLPLTGNGIDATVTHFPWLEGFENDVFPPLGWLTINPDNGSGWQHLEVGTTPLPGWDTGEAVSAPEGGDYMAYASYITGGNDFNDQWLITPPIITEDNLELKFHLRYFPNSYDDAFDILISTTANNNTEAFNIIVDQITFNEDSSTDWLEYNYVLSDFVEPETTIFIAFREHIADNETEGSAMMLDNIRIQEIVVSVEDDLATPMITKLYSNYPNPFNPETTISFSLQQKENVSVIVYNIRGQIVKTLINSVLGSGNHSVVWNGTDSKGDSVVSGVYFYRMQTGNLNETRKMLLLK